MTQTVPATCVLGPGKTGLTIGLRVLNLDGTTYSAFSTTGVAETSVAGTYRKTGGVVCPDAGAYIVWGVSGTDYAEATVESTSVNVTAWNGTAPSNLDANGYIRTDVMSWDGSTVDEVYPLVRPIDNSDGIEYIDRIYIRDAMKLAPSAGAPAAGSVDAHLDALALEATAQAILEDTSTTLPTAIAVVDANVDLLLAIDTSTTDATTAGAISRRRGNSWSIPLTIGAITGYTSLWFTIKSSHDDADTAAIVQIKKNASASLDGLLYVNGTTAADAAKGSITVSDATTGAIVIAVDETITDDLAPGEYCYDVQTLIEGDVATPDSGTFTVTADVTRSVE